MGDIRGPGRLGRHGRSELQFLALLGALDGYAQMLGYHLNQVDIVTVEAVQPFALQDENTQQLVRRAQQADAELRLDPGIQWKIIAIETHILHVFEFHPLVFYGGPGHPAGDRSLVHREGVLFAKFRVLYPVVFQSGRRKLQDPFIALIE